MKSNEKKKKDIENIKFEVAQEMGIWLKKRNEERGENIKR
ncbi:small, acid-soluble spore protein, alpha/beta type [Thermosyntropha sp.]|nr:small, acid-soluble spore protein, alpha/beta type [Thermosyntropha sp.]MBO8159453.1 small, acid-soluble spore protein, alpha/beta type [Thermosyntropha sp.]